MCSWSDYRYWKFHFDCLKASNFRSEKPMGGPFDPPPPPVDVRGLINMIYIIQKCCNASSKIFIIIQCKILLITSVCCNTIYASALITGDCSWGRDECLPRPQGGCWHHLWIPVGTAAPLLANTYNNLRWEELYNYLPTASRLPCSLLARCKMTRRPEEQEWHSHVRAWVGERWKIGRS